MKGQYWSKEFVIEGLLNLGVLVHGGLLPRNHVRYPRADPGGVGSQDPPPPPPAFWGPPNFINRGKKTSNVTRFSS